MKGTFPVNKFRELETPFYYYDVNVLRETLSCINKEAGKYNKLLRALRSESQCQPQDSDYYP